MIHLIKEAFQVYVYNVVVAFMDVLLRLLHGLMCIAIGAKAVAVFFELNFKLWAYHLMDLGLGRKISLTIE